MRTIDADALKDLLNEYNKHFTTFTDIQTQIILDIIDHAPTIEVEISDEDIIKFGDRYFRLKANGAKARKTHGNISQIDGTSVVPC